ncbi:MAG: hypothetical protein ACLQMO_15540 [Acidobacteriaceae bacterium]
MKTTAYFLRALLPIAVGIILGGVSPAQSSSTLNQNTTGPFGFTCGMSQQAITGMVGPLKDEGVNEYSTSAAPKPYPNVGYYLLTISPTQGLVMVKAETNDIETDTDGVDIIRQFHAIETELTKQYGQPTRRDDFLKPGSIWAGQDEWTTSYMKKERTLSSHWAFSNPEGCVTAIDLSAEVADPNIGAILISFEFKGYNPSQGSLK